MNGSHQFVSVAIAQDRRLTFRRAARRRLFAGAILTAGLIFPIFESNAALAGPVQTRAQSGRLIADVRSSEKRPYLTADAESKPDATPASISGHPEPVSPPTPLSTLPTLDLFRDPAGDRALSSSALTYTPALTTNASPPANVQPVAIPFPTAVQLFFPGAMLAAFVIYKTRKQRRWRRA